MTRPKVDATSVTKISGTVCVTQHEITAFVPEKKQADHNHK